MNGKTKVTVNQRVVSPSGERASSMEVVSDYDDSELARGERSASPLVNIGGVSLSRGTIATAGLSIAGIWFGLKFLDDLTKHVSVQNALGAAVVATGLWIVFGHRLRG
jgi:hypothetical protein